MLDAERFLSEIEPFNYLDKKGKGGPPEDEPHIKGKAVV